MPKEEETVEEDEFDENSIYDEEETEDPVDDDEMSPEEEGFMKGYDDTEEREDTAE